MNYKRALSPRGIYVMAGGSTAQMFQAILLGTLISKMGSNKMGSMMSKPNQKDLAYLKELVEAGKVVPVIDRCYPLSEVADAFRYLEEGHAKGKIVIVADK
jgi:NADPH:quinone reductase-like Zn-dependent oxidoreductase